MEVALGKKLSKEDFAKLKGSPTMVDVKKSYLAVAKTLHVPVPVLEAVTWNEQRLRHYPKTVRTLLF